MRLDIVSTPELVQVSSFSASYLPVTSGFAQRVVEDLVPLFRSLPAGWPLEDRLIAYFCPELKPDVFAFYGASGPDLAQILRQPHLVEKLDSEIVTRVHDFLLAKWTGKAPSGVHPQPRDDADAEDDPAEADVVVELRNGRPTIRLGPRRAERWHPAHCNRVLEIVTAVFARQQRFLGEGATKLVPMTRRDIADDTGLHEATVSRNVVDVTVRTPQGIFNLESLFGGEIPTASKRRLSSVAVRERVRELLNNELAGSPLTDAEVVHILAGEGIQLARRTVAKYRAVLGIPSALKRQSSHPSL